MAYPNLTSAETRYKRYLYLSYGFAAIALCFFLSDMFQGGSVPSMITNPVAMKMGITNTSMLNSIIKWTALVIASICWVMSMANKPIEIQIPSVDNVKQTVQNQMDALKKAMPIQISTTPNEANPNAEKKPELVK